VDEKLNSRQNNPNPTEIPEAQDALDNLKYKIADELNLNIPRKGKSYDWRMVPSYYCGAVGGEMVKRMIQFAERAAARGEDFTVVEENEEMAPHYNEDSATYVGPKQGDIKH